MHGHNQLDSFPKGLPLLWNDVSCAKWDVRPCLLIHSLSLLLVHKHLSKKKLWQQLEHNFIGQILILMTVENAMKSLWNKNSRYLRLSMQTYPTVSHTPCPRVNSNFMSFSSFFSLRTRRTNTSDSLNCYTIHNHNVQIQSNSRYESLTYIYQILTNNKNK